LKIGVLGDGGWGTTLALHLFKKGYGVCLWGAFPEYVEVLKVKRENLKFLPGIKIPKEISISSDLKDVIEKSELLILAIPSLFMRSVLKKVKTFNLKNKIILSVTKGIENNTLMRMSEVIQEELGNVNLAVLSGPTIAYEVARGVPTTCVIASKDEKLSNSLQEIFMTERFRVYTNSDLVGVELGGALKNTIAIACGISDGLGYGANTKAALLARGLVEITGLGIAMGAKKETFSGISGLGDLVTTCISPYSRNRTVGERIGRGEKLKDILSSMEMVAEGVYTTKSAYKLSLKYNVELPITKEVYLVLYRNKKPLKAVDDLMRREKKKEF
jgi:glycerol-3-phosphate dehydrogenase (NAD(P)+)